jgi:hypothetical protein
VDDDQLGIVGPVTGDRALVAAPVVVDAADEHAPEGGPDW